MRGAGAVFGLLCRQTFLPSTTAWVLIFLVGFPKWILSRFLSCWCHKLSSWTHPRCQSAFQTIQMTISFWLVRWRQGASASLAEIVTF